MLAVVAECLGLPARAVEREHQLAAQALTQRVLPNERLELAHQASVIPERQLGLDPLLDGDEAQLFQSRNLRLGEPLVRELSQRRAAPQAQRLPQLGSRAPGITARERAPSFGKQRLKPADIGLARLGLQHVAAPVRHQTPVPQHPPQVRHVALNNLVCARRRLFTPQLVDQPLRRDPLAAVDKQHRQQRSLLRRTQRKWAVVVDNLKRAEDAKFQHVRCLVIERYQRPFSAETAAAAHLPILDRLRPATPNVLGESIAPGDRRTRGVWTR